MRTPYERGHMNHIELFAGCGGMSLGFTEDFNLVMANEYLRWQLRRFHTIFSARFEE